MSAGQVVCYYTEGAYELEAKMLFASLERLGVSVYGEKIEGKQDWLWAVHQRAPFLRKMRKRYPKVPLLSLDADCFVHFDPWPYLWAAIHSGCDVACHNFRPGVRDELLPGTLLLMPTEGTDLLLDYWERGNRTHPDRPDRVNFKNTLQKLKTVRRFNLQPELCWIFDLSREAYGNKTPVVEHLQASRCFRRKRPGGGRYFNREVRRLELESII